MCLCASIYLLMAVGVERYLAVCRPHHYREVHQRPNRSTSSSTTTTTSSSKPTAPPPAPAPPPHPPLQPHPGASATQPLNHLHCPRPCCGHGSLCTEVPRGGANNSLHPVLLLLLLLLLVLLGGASHSLHPLLPLRTSCRLSSDH